MSGNHDKGRLPLGFTNVASDVSRAEGEGAHRQAAALRQGTDCHHELTAEQASRMAVTAVAADLEHWAHAVSVDGRVGLNDLVRVLDMIRDTSTPET